MIKAVIFDFDGLVVDTEIVSYRIYKELLQQYGYEYTIEQYAKDYSGKTEIANITRLINTYHLPWSVNEGMNLVFQTEERILKEGVELKKGVRELLNYLKDNNYGIALATSSTAERAFSIMNHHDIKKYFEAFVFAEDVSNSKPNPEIFLKAAEKLGDNCLNCLVLEDSEAGIEAANNAGIQVICVPDMKKPDQIHVDKTTAVLQSLLEVIDFLKETNEPLRVEN